MLRHPLLHCLQDPSNVQCADEAARAVISTMGGRSRITTMLMSFVKCLQRSHNELFKLIADILEETSTCANKSDMLDVIKCMSVDPPAKKISALVMKSADIVKCAVE